MSGGIGNTAASDLLKLLFQNTNWANVGDATGLRGSTTAGSFYVELSTGALSGSSTQSTTEAAYVGYGRVAIARSSGGWTVTGSAPTIAENAAATTFGASTSGPETEVAASIGRDSSGAGEVITWGPLSANLVVNNGITPSFAINALQATVQ
jgi:hypothetical protein